MLICVFFLSETQLKWRRKVEGAVLNQMMVEDGVKEDDAK